MPEADFDRIPTEELSDHVWGLILEDLKSRNLGADDYEILPWPAAMFLRVKLLDAEVANGGFNQFFFNCLGENLTETEIAIEQLLGEPHLSIFRQAVAIYLPLATVHQEIRDSAQDLSEMLSKFGHTYDQLDFSECDDNWHKGGKDFQNKMAAFAKRNRAVFLQVNENSELRIVKASSAQIEESYAIVQEYFEAIGVTARDDAAEFRQYFNDGAGVWLAKEGGEIAGCVALKPLPHSKGACEVKRLYVKPAYRGRQIANKLMEALHQYALAQGYTWCYLDSKSDLPAAIRLYENIGYEHCERYNDNPQATIFMRKRLG